MKKIINTLRIFRYLGKIDTKDIINGFIFGFVVSISMSNVYSSTSGVFWGALIAYVLIRSSFGKNDSLAASMAFGINMKVTYSYILYGVIGIFSYIVFLLAGKLFLFGMLSLGSGGMFDISAFNYQNATNYFYDILLVIGTLYLFFPVCFIGKASLRWMWMGAAALARFSYGIITSFISMNYGYENIQKLEEIDYEAFISYGFMERMPDPELHLAIFCLVVALIMIVSFKLAIKILRNHRRFGDNTGTLTKIKKHRTKIITIIVSVVFIVILAFGVMVAAAVRKASTKPEYEMVARSLTNDNCYGPVTFEGEVYFPAEEEEVFPEANNSEVIGYFGFNDEKVSLWYVLLSENFVYVDKNDKSYTYMKVRGCDLRDYIKASASEKKDLSGYGGFYIWDEDWSHQTAYKTGFEKAGWSEVNRDIINSLEERYGIVEYKAEDFENYEAYYTLTAFKDGKKAIDSPIIEEPHVVGCILKIDGNYYYGNKENLLTGSLLEEVKVVLESETG